tara:strand:- start:29448 stop:31343 length:1896 start_codon:yes stop_codon:yes gene_type:complete
MAKKILDDSIPDDFLIDHFIELGLENIETEEVQSKAKESPWIKGVPPPSMREFLESPDWLDEAYDWEMHTGARPVMVEQMEEIIKPDIREAILILGSGSGKGYASSRLAVYMAVVYLHLKDPQRYYGFTEGDPIYIVNLALDKDQAKNVIFKYISACVDRLPFLKEKLNDPDHIGVDKIEFINGLTILSGDSNFQGFFGYNILMAVLDELAFYNRVKKKDGTYVDYAKEGWQAIIATDTHGNLKDHYKCVGITTAGDYNSFAELYYDDIEEEHKNGEGENKYIERLPTWEVKPNMERSDFDGKFKLDYAWAAAKFGAEKGYGTDSYFTKDEKQRFREAMRNSGVQNLYVGNGKLDKGMIKPIPTARYFVHIDKAEKHDRLAIVMGHLHDKIAVDKQEIEDIKELSDYNMDMEEDEKLPVIKIDLITVVDPKGNFSDPNFITEINKTRRINSPKIRGFIYTLIKYGYNIVQVSFDSHEKDEYEIKFHERGIATKIVSTDKNKSISQIGKTSMISERVICPWNQILSDELDDLIDKGKKIDHIDKGSKDVYDAFSSVVYEITVDSATEEAICEPLFESGEDEQDFVDDMRHNRYARSFAQLSLSPSHDEDSHEAAFEFVDSDDGAIDAYGEIF